MLPYIQWLKCQLFSSNLVFDQQTNRNTRGYITQWEMEKTAFM